MEFAQLRDLDLTSAGIKHHNLLSKLSLMRDKNSKLYLSYASSKNMFSRKKILNAKEVKIRYGIMEYPPPKKDIKNRTKV